MMTASNYLKNGFEFETEDKISRNSINRVGERFVKNSSSREVLHDLQVFRKFRMECFKTSLGFLQQCKLPNNVILSARLKRLNSIFRKLNRKSNNFKLAEIDDILGFRIICSSLNEQEEIVNNIKHRMEILPKDEKNYLENNNNSDYRAVHLIKKFDQNTLGYPIKVRFEIQIRTVYQNSWANYSESFGENIKRGGRTEPTHKELTILEDLKKERDIIKQWEEDNPDKNQFDITFSSSGSNPIFNVVWKIDKSNPVVNNFSINIDEALKYLYYFEDAYSDKKDGALLLIGLIEFQMIEKLLRITHPNYSIGMLNKPSKLMTN